MRVKSCLASDGGGHVIQLSDEYGCVLRPKMISRFLKARGTDDRASVITYAFFHAFKFPDALSVHIKCKVEICRHGCLDHCQIHSNKDERLHPDLIHYHHDGTIERKDVVSEGSAVISEQNSEKDSLEDDRILYDDIIQEGEGGASIQTNFPGKLPLHLPNKEQENSKSEKIDEDEILLNKVNVFFKYFLKV